MEKIDLDNVRVVIVPHDDNLIEQQLFPLLLPQLHPLHRHLLKAVPLSCNADNSRPPDESLHCLPGCQLICFL